MKDFNIVLEYEKALTLIFKKLDLSAALCRFVRALITASNGETSFEISDKALAKLYIASDSQNQRNGSQNVRDNVQALEKWQVKNHITLVKIERGKRTRKGDGKYDFVKTKYEFALLGAFVKILFSESDTDLETRVTLEIQKLKDSFEPKAEKTKYHPRHLVRKAKRTIYAKLKVVFNLAQAIENVNPVDACQDILDESKTLLEQLENDYLQKENTKKRIEQFENRLSCAKAETCG